MFRLAKLEDLETISVLMNELFNSDMKAFYTKEGVKTLSAQITLKSLQERFFKDSVFYVDSQIQTVLEVEKLSHIAFLFSKQQNKGNAKAICNYFFETTKEEFISVGAFSQALGFYEKLEFIKVSEPKLVNGMPFTLMAKSLL